MTAAPLSSVLAEVGNDLSRLHPRALEVFHDGYVSGHRDGYRSGYVARAADEVAEWTPVRDHLTAYVRSLHGLKERREKHLPHDPRTGADLIAAAHASWGIPYKGVTR